MATIHTEGAEDRLHLSLLSSPKDYDNPNTGLYAYREEAQGKGCWIVLINTGYNCEQFPEVSQEEFVVLAGSVVVLDQSDGHEASCTFDLQSELTLI